MKVVKLESGLLSYQYSKSEQDATWNELMQDISPVATGETLYTPKDNLAYKILEDVHVGGSNYKVTLLANNKKETFTCDICKMQVKTYGRVRKMYS